MVRRAWKVGHRDGVFTGEYDLGSDLAQLAVGSLTRRSQDRKRFFICAPLMGHDDAYRFRDLATAVQGPSEVVDAFLGTQVHDGEGSVGREDGGC